MKVSFEKFYCPKCKKEFADGETECHSCGQPLKNQRVFYRCGEIAVSRESHFIGGISLICVGLLICWLGFSLWTSSLIATIIILIPGIALAIKGVRSIIIAQTARCPHCKHLITSVERRFNCPLCHGFVIRKGRCFTTELMSVKYPKPQYEAPASSSLSFSNSIAGQRIPTTNLEDDSRFFTLITRNFLRIGWDKIWDTETHRKSGQLDRIKRAVIYGDNIHIVQYNPLLGIAKIEGSSGNFYLTSGKRCSCPDYRKRLLPCKHIYKLSVFLNEEKQNFKIDTSFKTSHAHDNVFGGLRFSIVGRNQTPIKEFIIEHSGLYGDYSCMNVSALVLASDIMTQKRIDAMAHGVEILTFEQLQNLFDIFHDDSNVEETTSV